MEMTQKETDLLMYFMSTWLTYPIKLFGVIILKFYNFESQGHKQKVTLFILYKWERILKKQKDYSYFDY